MNNFEKKIDSFNQWRTKHLSNAHYNIYLSILTGIVAGLVAYVLKSLVHLINHLIESGFSKEFHDYYYFIYPFIGISLTVIFIKFILKQNISGGIPRVLYSISKEGALIKSHNTYSSLITSALTVGFGGSAGLEGPSVVTGAAIGSNISRVLALNFKQRILLLGCATAAAIATIFKAPFTGVIFVMEVFMLDLTISSIVPLVISSCTGVLLSYILMGQAPVYNFECDSIFNVGNIPFYLGLAIFCSLSSIYFTKCYVFVSEVFKKINHTIYRLIIGCLALAIMIFFFPSLYGEGYDAINACLRGDSSYLFARGFFINTQENFWLVVGLIFLVVIIKAFATSTTFAAGGIGGIFAPSLFIGANVGLLYALIANHFGANLPLANFALVAMAGTMSGVLHAPLTAVFLIAELTGGYDLFVPLLIVSVFSYSVTKKFIKNSIYTHQLAERNQLLTHHQDKNVLQLMSVRRMIETNFSKVKPEDTLGDLVKAVEQTTRNIFAVCDDQNKFLGIIKFDKIRTIIFHPELYNMIKVKDLMNYPDFVVHPNDTMESVAHIFFNNTDKYNLAVIDEDGKYIGFVSRAKIFSIYRRISKRLSEE